MVRAFWAGALGLLVCATPAAAEVAFIACTGSSTNGMSISRLFTVDSRQLREVGDDLTLDGVKKYDREFKFPRSITGYSNEGLVAQWDAYIRAQPLGHNGGHCVASADRELMIAEYRKLRSRGYNKLLADKWRPTGGVISDAIEWPEN